MTFHRLRGRLSAAPPQDLVESLEIGASMPVREIPRGLER
jgi:hypothetical protein